MQKRKEGQPHKGWKASARKRHDRTGELRAALEASTELLVTVLHPGGAEQYSADIEKRVGDNRSLLGAH